MIFLQCKICHASLSAEDAQAGTHVRCPTCLATLTVPAPAKAETAAPPLATRAAAGTAAGASAGASAGTLAGASATMTAPPPVPRATTSAGLGRRYGFNCAYCSSRLEASEAMAAQEGQCPTCGNAIVIPILDRHGRLIDPITRQIIKPDPHPVHAYAAAGERAPAIERQQDGTHAIRCAKCRKYSPITANNCKHCGMPFTMEGTAPEAAGASNGFATASMVLGIIGIPFACTFVVPLLAAIFGGVALAQISRRPADAQAGRGMAIAGLICGLVGLAVGGLIINR